MSKIVFGTHIVWYEKELISEYVESILNALNYQTPHLPVEFEFYLNIQTYLEQPINDNIIPLFLEKCEDLKKLPNHSIKIIDNTLAFYSIGDYRRELSLKSPNGFVVWGETDCLVPQELFYLLGAIPSNDPYVLSFGYRKMWDASWNSVEHPLVQGVAYGKDSENILHPMKWNDTISLDELYDINSKVDELTIYKFDQFRKFDGSLLVLYKNVIDLIPENMHFCHEDTMAMYKLWLARVPQYHISNILKGHNYRHPNKRVGTNNTRDDEVYKKYHSESESVLHQFLESIHNNV